MKLPFHSVVVLTQCRINGTKPLNEKLAACASYQEEHEIDGLSPYLSAFLERCKAADIRSDAHKITLLACWHKPKGIMTDNLANILSRTLDDIHTMVCWMIKKGLLWKEKVKGRLFIHLTEKGHQIIKVEGISL